MHETWLSLPRDGSVLMAVGAASCMDLMPPCHSAQDIMLVPSLVAAKQF